MMKKTAILIAFCALLLFSCGKRVEPPLIRDGADLTLKVSDAEDGNGGASSADLVLSVTFDGDAANARFVSPERMASVTAVYRSGAVTLECGYCEVPLSADAANGATVLFEVLDFLRGKNVGGATVNDRPETIEVSGYEIRFSYGDGISFEVSDGGRTRVCTVTEADMN